MKDEVTTLKKDFKQKENKYLEYFLDMKALKEKVEDKLFKQDQSLQTVHMLCKPKPFYDEKKKVAIGYKNPLYLTSAMQVQSALYNGHEIVKTNHAPAVVLDSKDTLELAKITRKNRLEKMKSPPWVKNKIKTAPLDYSKENYLATLHHIDNTLREIVEEARIEKPLDNALEYACFYTKRSQELLEYVIGTFLKEFSKRDKKVATTPLNRNKQVAIKETCETLKTNTQTHVEQQKLHKTNVLVIPSTGVNSSTEASRSNPRSNTKNNRIFPAKSDNKKKV
ncbi:hypothetical protein Tco_1096068 [Tanacetum coccineum]